MASTLQQEVAAVQLTDYACLVTIIAVGYDYILTFPDEIEYVWNKPWTHVSTLYILARYSGLCAVIINSFLGTSFLSGSVKPYVFMVQLLLIDLILLIVFDSCEILNTSTFWIFAVFIGVADLAMILRVWILYKKSILILRTLLMFYAIQIIVRVVGSVIISTNFAAPVITEVEVLDISFCTFEADSALANWIGITFGIVQMILGGLMCLLVGVRFIKQSLQVYRATKRFELGRYMSLLTRDGLFYFLVILSNALFSLLTYAPTIPSDELWWWYMLNPILQTVPVVTLTPRLILTLRKLYARVPSRRESDTDTLAPFSSMDSNRDEGGTFMFKSTVQEEGLEQPEGEEIQMVGREIPIDGPGSV